MELLDAKIKVDELIQPLKDKSVREIQAFIKSERYPNYKEFRGIYSRSDKFKVIAGPIFKTIEKVVYSIKTNSTGSVSLTDNSNHSEVFVKHVPVLKRAEHILNKLKGVGRRYIATDYTAFEKHFTKEVMELLEFQLYRHLFKCLPLQLWFLNQVLEVLSGDNTIRFRRFWMTMKAGRMSGEMNTSLGNGFANYMIFLFVNDLLGNTDVDCVIEGDDCAGCYSGISPTSQLYDSVGFTCKIELVPEVTEASFCGLIYDDLDQLSICDPIKVLLKVGWSSSYYVGVGEKMRKKLFKAKILSLIHQYPGVPIIQPYARKMYHLLNPKLKPHFGDIDKYVVNEIIALCDKDIPPPTIIMPRTRFLMSRIFGVSVDEQILLERFFEDMSVLPEHYDHPIIRNHITSNQVNYYQRFTSHDNKLVYHSW